MLFKINTSVQNFMTITNHLADFVLNEIQQKNVILANFRASGLYYPLKNPLQFS